MTSVSYEEIFSDFLGNVGDYDFASLNTSDAYGLMTEYLQKSLKQSYVRDLFKSIICDNEILSLSFELENTIDDVRDRDFVVGIISKAMVVEWIKPQVRNRKNIAQMFAGKEQKYYSQSAHLAELRGLLEDVKLELRKEIRDRSSLHNSYIGGIQ